VFLVFVVIVLFQGVVMAKKADIVPVKSGSIVESEAYSFGVDRFESFGSNDIILPTAHLFQGLPKEAERYGQHKVGDIVDSVTKQKIADPQFVPILAYKEWIKWKPRSPGVWEYITRDIAHVDPKDLEFVDGEAPAATEYHNWVVLFAGHDMPRVIRCKRNGIKSSRTLYMMERSRRTPGLYRMDSLSVNNTKGNFLVPRFSLIGDPPKDLLASCAEFYQRLKSVKIGVDGDDIVASESIESGGSLDEEVPF
jgi:hypothetical protein